MFLPIFFLTRNFPSFEVNRAYTLYITRLSLQTHRMNKCKQPLRRKTNDKLMALAYVYFGNRFYASLNRLMNIVASKAVVN